MHLFNLFIQSGFSELSLQLLWTVTLILLALTLLLFASSLIARSRYRSQERKVEKLKEKLYPLILYFIDDEITLDDLKSEFTDEGLEYEVFEDIIFEMLETVRGPESDKLRRLLHVNPIFKYHSRQLNSRRTAHRIKACHYFSYLKLVDEQVIKKLFSFLSSDNTMLVFSAASALMASPRVQIRSQALQVIAERPNFSAMALLEMTYKFHNSHEDQQQGEADALKEIILNKKMPPKSLGILIKGASELGYQNLVPTLWKKLSSTKKRWKNHKVLPALIKAQGVFLNIEAGNDIKKYSAYKHPEVRQAVAEALGMMGGEENLLLLQSMVEDDNFEVKLTAVKALQENEDEGEQLLEESMNKYSMVESVAAMPSNN